MSNTERLAVLQKVRIAHDAVEGDRVQNSLAGDEQTALTKLAFLLDDLEDTLILQDITTQVESIKAAAANLTDLVASMKQASAAIAKDLSLVNDAAGAVSALATIVSLGVSHGLV
jgi:hypothetical protein